MNPSCKNARNAIDQRRIELLTGASSRQTTSN